MKVLMLNYEFPPLGGGSGMANYHILEEFKHERYERQLEIDLLTSSSGGFRIEQFAPHIKIHYLDIHKNEQLHHQSLVDLLRYSFSALRYARKLCRKNDYQLVHAFFGIPCGVLAYCLKKPYIVSLRGSDVPFHTPKFKTLDRLFFKRLSRFIWIKALYVVANSKGLREEALHTLPSLKAEIITNGIDLERYRSSPTQTLAKGVLRVVSVGRLAHHKGQALLIKALSGQKDVELVLVGDGPQRDEFSALARECKVDVRFTGKVDHNEVKSYLFDSDLFVLPSLNEGMSNAVLEAMACGLPIVCTNVGGAEELVKGNGFVVAKNDVSALTRAINQYKDHPELLLQHRECSLLLINDFSWKNVADQYFELYKKTEPCAE